MYTIYILFSNSIGTTYYINNYILMLLQCFETLILVFDTVSKL